jgi:acetyl esterase
VTGPVPRPRLADRVQFRAARWLAALPPPWQVRLSGRPAVRIDGLTLDPQLQLLLALRQRRGGGTIPMMTPPRAREWARQESAAASGRPVRVGAVTDLTVDGAAGPLPARHYVPVEPGWQPLLVFLHGGGFVIGDLDTHDQACRLLCRHARVHVLAVDYRLAPEHPFPAAVQDARAALRWAGTHAHALGADPARVAIGGDSAGGNLSAVVAQCAADDGGPAPVLQLLLYPAIDRGSPYRSLTMFGEGFFLTADEIAWFDRHYCGPSAPDEADPRRNPLHRSDLSGLAPALVVTAGFDPLRDEGEVYAAALAAAGTPVTLRRKPGMIHGFANMVDVSPAARAALLETAADLRTMLHAEANGRA